MRGGWLSQQESCAVRSTVIRRGRECGAGRKPGSLCTVGATRSGDGQRRHLTRGREMLLTRLQQWQGRAPGWWAGSASSERGVLLGRRFQGVGTSDTAGNSIRRAPPTAVAAGITQPPPRHGDSWMECSAEHSTCSLVSSRSSTGEAAAAPATRKGRVTLFAVHMRMTTCQRERGGKGGGSEGAGGGGEVT